MAPIQSTFPPCRSTQSAVALTAASSFSCISDSERRVRRNEPRRKSSAAPCCAPFAPGMTQRFLQFLKLPARATQSYERDKRGQHFVGSFADLIDSRVPEHPLEGPIREIGSAAIHLKNVVHQHPDGLGAEDFEH